ncbi:GDYXXLXY domain-containing protein [Achromobacter sp. GG226]|uniref:GDYXXLXY domain-containing protein n=1 Tax=Verticiella alkaliphila TaxID=2779529 RepID=UPI001C0CD6CB|nr:GDYXXLXY domain-containing protein [Verticiella sp. GG226]MBU4609207.1 GDYXXLXY domain-containing protein [Verticiella sp. GG226]
MTSSHSPTDTVAALSSSLMADGVWRTPASRDAAGTPWFVTLLQAGAAWLAALLLLPFLGWFLLGMGEARMAVPIGVVAFGIVAALLGRLGRERMFLGQLGAALGLAAGIIALAWAYDRAFGWILPAVLAVSLYLAGPSFSNRLLNGFTLCAAVYVSTFRGDPFDALLAGSLTAAAMLGWTSLLAWAVTAWPRCRQALAAAPLAWACAVSAGLLVLIGAEPLGTSVAAPLVPGEWQAARIACAVLPLAAWTFACAQPGAPRLGRGVATGVAAVLLLLVPLGHAAPGIALAVAWLIVGFAQSRLVLLAAAALGVLGYLGRYYYQLDVSLLHKAAWLAGAGLVLGLAAVVSGILLQREGRRAPVEAGAEVSSDDSTSLTAHGDALPQRPALWPRVGLVLGLLLALTIGNLTVARYDRVVMEGQPLVLALAPVDPRSLMQGDYMTLRFTAAAEINEAVRYVAGEGREKRPAYAVFRSTELHAPAQWIGLLDTLGPLQPGEVAVRLTPTPRGVRFGTDAYFFEEGQASRYEAARFGEFRVDTNGTAILVGLRDGEGRPL